MFKRVSVFIYGVVSYLAFLGTILYAIGFVGDLWVPRSIDGVPERPLLVALLIDSLLLGLFAVQHSVMARPAFKRWITRFIPRAAERSTYSLASSAALIAVFAFWEPIGGVVWSVEDPLGRAVLYGLFGFGWLLVLLATFMISHFDLLGLRQVWLYLVGREYTPLRFETPWLYRYIRHPLYLGFLFALWATPTMTSAHLVFALLATGYIVVGSWLEERDLMAAHPEYADYRKRVGMLIPRFGGSQAKVAAAGNA
jgi:protein-S-isoprenylcysteine O-methyltransferase Ste14